MADIANLIATGITPMGHVDTPTEAAIKGFAARNSMVGGQDQHALSGEALQAAQIENRQKQMDLDDQEAIRAIMRSLNPQTYGSAPNPTQGGATPPPQVLAAMKQPQATDQPAGNLVPGLVGVTNGDVQQASAPDEADAPIASSTSVAPAPQQNSGGPDYDELIARAGPMVQPKTLMGLHGMVTGLKEKIAMVNKTNADAAETQGKLEQSHREALSSLASQLEKNPGDWDTGFAVLEHGTQGAYRNELESLRQMGNQSPDVRNRLISQMKAGGMKPTDQATLVNTQTEGKLKQMELFYRQQYDGLSAPERSAEIQKQQALAVEAQKNKDQKAYQNATLRLRSLEVDPGGMVSAMSGGGQGQTQNPVAPPAPQQTPQGAPVPQGQAAAPEGLHGEAFLRTLPPMLRDQVKALSEGRSQITARGGSGFQGLPLVLRNAVQQYDPTFSENRFKARQQFDPGGESNAKGKAASTALGHLGLLHEAGDALAQHDLPALNEIQNKLGLHVGPGVSAEAMYDAIAHNVAPELSATYVASGGGARADIEDQLKKFVGERNPATRHAIEQVVVHMLDSKMDTERNSFKTAMGPMTPAWEPLSPEAKTIRDKILAPANALPKGNGARVTPSVIDQYYRANGKDPAKTKAALRAAGWK